MGRRRKPRKDGPPKDVFRKLGAATGQDFKEPYSFAGSGGQGAGGAGDRREVSPALKISNRYEQNDPRQTKDQKTFRLSPIPPVRHDAERKEASTCGGCRLR